MPLIQKTNGETGSEANRGESLTDGIKVRSSIRELPHNNESERCGQLRNVLLREHDGWFPLELSSKFDLARGWRRLMLKNGSKGMAIPSSWWLVVSH